MKNFKNFETYYTVYNYVIGIDLVAGPSFIILLLWFKQKHFGHVYL